ncbi:MAG: ATP-dependent DNA helicase RecG [Treponema sp.]|nr:ATP-dependent DNA helicase RecG [Treponema sp.]MCL2230158.1 ATP-dependent DNA helicase RecG [Treponema sp.]
MFVRSINNPINSINGIGPSAVPKLSRLGITKVSNLLLYYPRDYEDRQKPVLLKDFQKEKVCSIVNVFAKEWIGYGNMKTLKIYIEDESAQASLMCYNRPFMDKTINVGSKYLVCGRFYFKYNELQSSSFELEEEASMEKSFGRIFPIYPLTSGITQKMMQKFTKNALDRYGDLSDELPNILIEKYNLLDKNRTIREIHYPSSFENLEKAKKTLIYEELFYLEVMVGKRALERKSKRIKTDDENDNDFSMLQKRLLERLGFSMTDGQIEATKEINRDLSKTGMARLLQGDVGCGKTLVAFLAALKNAEKNRQTAILAPTELLANQHAQNAARILEPIGIRIAFLTGNIKTKGRKELLKNLKAGEIDIVVGTHALFSNDVEYKNLGLVIIDEQHRFGVTQRSLIMSKGDTPSLLMMSATPIPRTLALTVFGDMDVSVIKDMPPGRKPVKTHLASVSNEQKVYDFARKELEKGRQAYFVYPLIEGGDDIKDALSGAERLSKEIFPKCKTAVIHSKLPEDEKKQIMDDFRKGDIQILAATSVVEVGVDVPNATCIVIHNAERFGLSALHQLRGRVGRGSEQSFCFLVYSDEYTQDAKMRLIVMLENNDGFVIAEEDLKIRGPGLVAGTEQSGFLVLGMANPIRDNKILEIAREDAFSILENDPDLLLENNRVISKVLEEAPPFCDVTF